MVSYNIMKSLKQLKQISIFKRLSVVFFTLIFTIFTHFHGAVKIQAQGQILGIHILQPYELADAKKLLTKNDESDAWHYVTIPLSLNDVQKKDEWQGFFDQARADKVIPIVRLVTKIENESWKVPSRFETVQLLSFLSQLEWPTAERHIIIFNEVNHAKEWGGTINPAEYAGVLEFASSWAHSENKNFVVLPAAMDLAAPNGSQTMEAFTYLKKMQAANPEILTYIDKWNSHSYPNPGFSASPTLSGQNSLRGFEIELAYLKAQTGKDYQVFITETGWVANRATQRWLDAYYAYAVQHIWSHPQIVAVTPFLLRGDPGPFKSFTFLDEKNQPTAQYRALQKALQKS